MTSQDSGAKIDGVDVAQVNNESNVANFSGIFASLWEPAVPRAYEMAFGHALLMVLFSGR